MIDLIGSVAGFLIMGMLCCLLERVWPEDRLQLGWRPDSRLDVLYLAIRIGLSVLLVIATALAGHALPSRQPYFAGLQPFWLQLVEVLLLSDLITYWSHRFMHAWYPLWRVHAIHHTAEEIDWLVAARNHPAELVINKVLSSLPLYFLGFAPDVFATVVPLTAAYSLLLHANVSWSYGPLRYILASPAFHRWHHSSDPDIIDKNLAQIFAFYDWLFGTLHFPASGHPQKYGLPGKQVRASFWDHLLYPIRRRAPRIQIVTATVHAPHRDSVFEPHIISAVPDAEELTRSAK
jgi:sterol desaturase/sphingolipid hydroxylase (fatty acid hydroxylase superfamily)